MSNPLPNEDELFTMIRRDRIIVPDCVWEVMFSTIGDHLAVIYRVVSRYSDNNEDLPIEEADNILRITKAIARVVSRVVHPETIEESDEIFRRIREEKVALNPVIKELFTHYLGNDTHIINMCVSFYLDPKDTQPVLLADAKKILKYVLSMRTFLERLRQVTKGSS